MSKISKKSSNGFASFMFEYKSQEKANGRDLDMNTVTVEAGKLWQVSLFYFIFT